MVCTFFSSNQIIVRYNLSKKQELNISGLSQIDQINTLSLIPTIESGSSIDISLCPSPTLNVASLSPMPDLRRDSQPEEILTLPAPDGFADRRNSENILQG